METNYFVCTLGQAALPDISRPFRDVNHLIDQQASQHPDLPAVGFYTPNEKHDKYNPRVITFKEVRQGVLAVASDIAEETTIQDGQTVGLLCNSSPAFLFTWLGLVRLGHPVLLIAPQCSPSAIAHLSKACHVTILFHDRAHQKLAHEAVACSSEADFSKISAYSLPFQSDEAVFQLIYKNTLSELKLPSVSETNVAYLHHTSGTSTGVPKPIPQTHLGGVAVLPSLDGSAAATFTTTPLYHGGVADVFRAWTSSAMIWLFPAQHVPITATNIVRCISASHSVAQTQQGPAVRYFSSVPYVLQMMAEDMCGLSKLQEMDIVGVGGAALPAKVGDELVSRNVNLVSRYGSAECGFLMSSHRDYAKDKEWQYLRRPKEVAQLHFEEQDDGQSELVILPGWPHMAKTNRDNGSFATSDLFAPHPTILNAWKYHSRADSQLTLITGKKFDPAPLEGSLAASSLLLNEVLIFGNGKPYPGALLFRSETAQDTPDVEIIQQLASIVEKLNTESQSHARIPRNMLIPMPFEITPLDKSSKGTVLRGKAEDKFEQQIEAAYSKTTFGNDKVADIDLPSAISKIVTSVVGRAQCNNDTLTPNTDLFAYGVDSVACVQIRHALLQLVSKDAEPLPMTVVEDSGTISKLSDTIKRHRRGEEAPGVEDQGQILQQVVDKYGSFDETGARSSGRSEVEGYTVLLTGPTGLLGAHVLAQLLSRPQVEKIYLLIRGATPFAAKERVLKALSSRMLPISPDFDRKICVMPCKLSEPKLGLSDADYQILTNEVNQIFHLAWSVNFLISLRSLASTHLAGLQNLLNLALASKRDPQFLFCSSVASVSGLLDRRKVPESIVEDFSACGKTGYAQSKLAAELICFKCATTTRMRNRVKVLRVGQLSGDSKNGIWNVSEAYPLMLASSRATGVLPDLKNETLGWLPVDVAARCYMEAAFGVTSNHVSTVAIGTDDMTEGPEIEVFHLLNTSKVTTFSDVIDHVKSEDNHIKTVSANEWLEKLGDLQKEERKRHHPALKLLSFWKEVYGSTSTTKGAQTDINVSEHYSVSGHSVPMEGDEYETASSIAAMPSLLNATGPLQREYILKLWHWIDSSVARENCTFGG